ncbi:hypothetical protein LTR86_010817 [Recurvomyces mirabilis]|nr:hypothetical protein LTR86_010817 [Recurvomyces mirabilis]
MKPNLLPFLREKWDGVPPATATFTDKTVLVTGSNAGLGFEAAALFVTLNATRVILGVRSVSKGLAAREQIEKRTGRVNVVDVWELDMGSYASISAFAARVNTGLSHLHVAVLNAGITAKNYILGSEGWESTLQVNVLGTALLGSLLLPRMKASMTTEQNLPHLVVVTSEAHRWLEAKDFPDIQQYQGRLLEAVNAKPSNIKHWDGMLQNARSKLFAMYVTRSLAEVATSPSGEVQTVVTSVCPGACKSELAREFKASGVGYAIGLKLFDLLLNKPTEEGARVYIAASVVGKEGHGGWYKTTALTSPGSYVTSHEGQKMQSEMWREIATSLKASGFELS